MKTRLILSFILVLLSLQMANAATYYVDASFGNDKWSGLQSSRIGSPTTDGPWQSLAKVSAKLLTAGDRVLLKCGGIWNETLTLKGSGTAASPIIISAYPSNACTNKPIIRGSTTIPAHNWIRETGNIYKISTAMDLITFGTFDNSLGNWTKWSANNSASMRLSNSCPQANNNCMSFSAGSGSGIVTSNYFLIQGKQSYTASFSIKVPQGVRVEAIVRRGAPPWDSVGLATAITGTGNWQNFSLPFIGTALSTARMDFAVPAGATIGLDNVKMTLAITGVSGVFENGKAVNVAHHPNRGHDPIKPRSLFYTIAENADLVTLSPGRSGSSYVTTGTDLSTIPHPAITPGTGIRIRTNSWAISDHKVSSVSGARLYLDSPSPYPVIKGWGYFLYGQRWMLDEPGEWYYNPATKTIYVWMPDSAAPGNRVSIGQSTLGIQASTLSHIRIESIAIQNVGTGVRLDSAANIVLRNLAISDTLGVGVDAPLTTDSGIENSQIIRTLGDAIASAPPGRDSLRFHAYDNLIIESGVRSKNGFVQSLPVPGAAAIQAGRSATIRGNRIYETGYIGIRPVNGSLIFGNHIEYTCLVLDDCGAIYTNNPNNNSIIENNTILHVMGNSSGKPVNYPSQAQGIYLDDLSSGVTVRGNTVVNADNGMHIHNAATNRIENNTFYENRGHQIWLQEGSKSLNASGDLHGNLVLGNRFFPTTTALTIGQNTDLLKTNTERFASFDRNLYFTFLRPNIVSESWPSGTAVYTLPKWKTAVTSTNVPRNLDATSREVNDANRGYTYRILRGNIVPNGNLSSNLLGWSAWNQTAPGGQIVQEPCPVTGQCLRYTAGGSVSLLNSPSFSVQKNQWYKISFDIKVGVNDQTVSVIPRRGGGGINGYEPVMGPAYIFKVKKTTNLQRFSALFKAHLTVNAGDPITLDNGARIDFYDILAGHYLTVTNLEVVPVSAVDATFRSQILINSSSKTLSLSCPDGTNTLLCGKYVRFTDSQSVTWPYTLPPHGSEIIYSFDSATASDGDKDGIPDDQDKCNGTIALQAVNAAGCALGQ